MIIINILVIFIIFIILIIFIIFIILLSLLFSSSESLLLSSFKLSILITAIFNLLNFYSTTQAVDDFFLKNFDVDFESEFENDKFETSRDIIEKTIKF